MADQKLSDEQLWTILSNGQMLDGIEAFLPVEIRASLVDFQCRAGNAWANVGPTPTLQEAQQVFGAAFLALDHVPDARSKLRLIMVNIGLTPSAPSADKSGMERQ